MTLSVFECQRCSHRTLSHQECCPFCGIRGSYYPVEREIQGRISSFVMVHVPDERFQKKVPYPLVFVECGHGLQLRGHLDAWNQGVEAGTSVKLQSYSQGVLVFVPVA